MTLSLYNTLTRKKEPFAPLDKNNVRMYVCGPTVYDRPHIGNARSVVVYDVLYRLLCHLYGKEHVTYVRNITDVDDKINAAAKANGEPISALTKRVEGWFHGDMAALGCLNPTREPKATAHIKQMIGIIEKLIANKHAYAAQGHVLFAVDSYKEYGRLSGRKLEELVAGARVEVESYKRDASDFVLWKPSKRGQEAEPVMNPRRAEGAPLLQSPPSAGRGAPSRGQQTERGALEESAGGNEETNEPGWDSPWGYGRPGWHIECSAMSSTYLGDTFDLHGGGADLMFPHHENEIAQSICAHPGSGFARAWVHNGFLTVNGEKMSKSLGNFITVRDLLDQGVKGEVVRYALLSTGYNKPLDWNAKLLEDAKKAMDKFYRELAAHPQTASHPPEAFVEALSDDLNTPIAISLLHGELKPGELRAAGALLGLFEQDPDAWFHSESRAGALGEAEVLRQIDARAAAKKAKNFAAADRIRQELADQGILLEDKPGGVTEWRRV